MSELDQMRSFLEDYAKYVDEVLEPNYFEIRRHFRAWKLPDYWSKTPRSGGQPNPSPIQRFHIRIKRPESVADKIFRKRDAFPRGLEPPSFEAMQDTIGGRLIVYFMSHLPLIDREIRTDPILELSEEHKPIAYLPREVYDRLGLIEEDCEWRRKESGYASLHYVVRLAADNVPLERRPWFELQVRTIIEDAWSEVEHILGYKPGKRTSLAVRKQFQILSGQLLAVDDHFDFLSQELARFQEEARFADSDPLNAENLPSVLSEIEVSCAQNEIDGMLKVMASRGVFTVGTLRQLGTTSTLERLRHTFVATKGRQPNSFEVVANLANVLGCDDEVEQVGRIRAQIAFLDAWNKIQEDLRRKREKER